METERMLALLLVAKCPACDGSGAYYAGTKEDPDVVQCQWCDERQTLIEMNKQGSPELLEEGGGKTV